jgi:hypothetical protein
LILDVIKVAGKTVDKKKVILINLTLSLADIQDLSLPVFIISALQTLQKLQQALSRQIAAHQTSVCKYFLFLCFKHYQSLLLWVGIAIATSDTFM